MHPGKAKPHSPPTWVRLSSVGAGLVWGVLPHGLRVGFLGTAPSLLVSAWGGRGGSPAPVLGSDISPAPQHFSFPSRNKAVGADEVARRVSRAQPPPHPDGHAGPRRCLVRPRCSLTALGPVPGLPGSSSCTGSCACPCPIPPQLRATPLLCTPVPCSSQQPQ